MCDTQLTEAAVSDYLTCVNKVSNQKDSRTPADSQACGYARCEEQSYCRVESWLDYSQCMTDDRMTMCRAAQREVERSC